MNQVLQRIFRSQKNRGQLLFAGLGFLFGFVLLLSSLYVYLQIRKTFSNSTELPDYLILSKQVTLLNVLGASTFQPQDLEDLKKQPFYKSMAIFRSGNFKVWAYGNEYLQFQTELFFEAIQENFLGKIPPKWDWQESDKFVPVIIPKDFVDQYNFVYAPSQGLPLISEALLPSVPAIEAKIYSNKGERRIKLKIVGFEERIPSILVPESFLNWANKVVGTAETDKDPARIVLQVSNPASPELATYLKEKNLQVNKEKTLLSQIAGQVVQVLGVIGILGVAFVLLSLVIVSMSFQLIMSESKDEIRLLLQLGYTSKILANFLQKSFLRFISFYAILGIFLTAAFIYIFYEFMQTRGVAHLQLFEPLTVLFGSVFIGLTILYNILNIRKLVKEYQ
ncbi:MAG: hypothetical protein OHK0045_07300 [Raineya sp.]